MASQPVKATIVRRSYLEKKDKEYVHGKAEETADMMFVDGIEERAKRKKMRKEQRLKKEREKELEEMKSVLRARTEERWNDASRVENQLHHDINELIRRGYMPISIPVSETLYREELERRVENHWRSLHPDEPHHDIRSCDEISPKHRSLNSPDKAVALKEGDIFHTPTLQKPEKATIEHNTTATPEHTTPQTESKPPQNTNTISPPPTNTTPQKSYRVRLSPLPDEQAQLHAFTHQDDPSPDPWNADHHSLGQYIQSTVIRMHNYHSNPRLDWSEEVRKIEEMKKGGGRPAWRV